MQTNPKKARVAILIPDMVELRTRTISRDKDGYLIMIKDQFIKKM